MPFLLDDCDIALVTGIGDVIRPLDLNLKFNNLSLSAGSKNFSVKLVRPEWSVGTREAYAAIDANLIGLNKNLDENEAQREIDFICSKLLNGERVGLLPNDFYEFYLADKYSGYRDIFKKFESEGCAAWGLSGSGSAAFGIKNY